MFPYCDVTLHDAERDPDVWVIRGPGERIGGRRMNYFEVRHHTWENSRFDGSPMLATSYESARTLVPRGFVLLDHVRVVDGRVDELYVR